MKNLKPHLILLFVLIPLSLFLSFYNISKHPAQLWDEETNINVVNQSEKLLELRLDDDYFFEKPPLWYWFTMGVTNIFGDNLISYRFISAISGVGVMILCYLIANKLWGRKAGLISALSIMSVGHFYINNVSGYFSTHSFRSADLDSLQLFFIMAGILCYINYKKKSTTKSQISHKINLYMTFVFSGLAVMTKGPLGLLPIIMLLIDHPKISSVKKLSIPVVWEIVKKHHLIPFILFLIVVIPWHLIMYRNFGTDFINKYFIYHMVLRSTRIIEEHCEDIFFYTRMFINLKVFSLGIPTLWGIVYLFLNHKKINLGEKLALAGILIPLIMFSLIPTKLAWYNLYIYPFVALLIGYFSITKLDNKYINLTKTLLIFFSLVFGIAQNVSWVLSLSTL